MTSDLGNLPAFPSPAPDHSALWLPHSQAHQAGASWGQSGPQGL